MAALPHDYRPDIPFTEPPADDEDTRPYEWTPPLQEPVVTHDEQQQARRIIDDFISARRSLSSVEGVRYAAHVDYHGMEEEPLEPDELMALDRQHTNWLAQGVRSFGRSVFRRCNDMAAWLERGA